MKYNATKCKLLTVTRSRSPIGFNYNLDGSMLESVGTFNKDLGVVIDKNLCFTSHIKSVVSKSNRVCGMIKRSVGYNAPQNVKLLLYKTLARPILEYCSQVWSPHLKKDILLIESVQRSMTNYILNSDVSLSYQERSLQLEILPLSYRREIAYLMFLYKYLNGSIAVDFNELLKVNVSGSHAYLRSSCNACLLLKDSLTRTELFKASYFNRIPQLWNILPSDLRNLHASPTFK